MGKWADQPSRHARGYDHLWVKLRKRILQRDLWLCQTCMDQGRVRTATEVDHVIPKAKGGTDDEANLSSVCKSCHGAKTVRDMGGSPRPRRTIGISGWPYD